MADVTGTGIAEVGLRAPSATSSVGTVSYAAVSTDEANGIVIRCLDPATGKVTQFLRSQRHNFSYDSMVNGGDHTAQWSMECGQIPSLGLPDLAARVEVINTPRNKIVWSGTLRKPVEHMERGVLQSVDFFALGYGYAPLIPFGEPTRFGPSPGMATLAGYENTGSAGFGGGPLYNVITDLKDVMLYGLTHMPLIIGNQNHIATTGIFPLGNTEEFRGKTSPDLWTAVCALTTSLGTPYYWMVYADDSGVPCLFFLAEMPTTAEYFERGTAKTVSMGIDADEIANLISAPFQGNGTVYAPDVGNDVPIDYSAIFDIQGHILNPGAEIRTYEDTQAFAEGVLTKMNQRVVHEGQVVLDRDIRAHFTGEPSAEMIPFCEVRAGKTIELAAPATPYHAQSVEYVFVRSARYDEEACQTTLSANAISAEGKDARLLQLLTNRGMVWGALSAKFNWVAPDLHKLASSNGIYGYVVEPAKVTIIGGGEAVGPPPEYGSPNTKPPAPPANTLPKTTDDPATTQPPIVGTIGAGAQSTADNPWFGPYGIQNHPYSNAPERANITGAFMAADMDGNLTDGMRLILTDIQAGTYDTLTIAILDDIVMSVEVHVDVYHWDTDSTDTDVFVIPLVSDFHNRVIYDNSTPAKAPIILNHGDQLKFRVVGADSNQAIFVGISGWKIYPWFPNWQGDPHVPWNVS